MTRLLPSVLTVADLPAAELHAARLDGELVTIDECFCPVDGIDSAELRGRAVAAIVPSRLIAEQRTAAWILGALDHPPARHQLCADSGARYRTLGKPRFAVREVILDDGATLEVGGIRVTTPLRTAVDLARFADDFDGVRQTVVRLARIGQFTVNDAAADLDRRRHLPGKVRALSRLRGALRLSAVVEAAASAPAG